MFKDYLETNYLEAERLMGEFTFGFELEGWVNDESSDPTDFTSFVKRFFSKIKTINNSKPLTKGDSSINPEGLTDCRYCNGTGEVDEEICGECDGIGRYNPGYDGDLFTFEVASPILVLNPLNISKTIEFLTYCVNEYNVMTNETCGFHVHIGFPEYGATPIDIFWSLCNMVLNEELYKNVKSFKGVNFYSRRYASTLNFNEIRNTLKNKDKSISEKLYIIAYYYNNSKYLSFRQHPQGTLEWRGPRGFINSPNLYKEFFVKVLYKLVKFLNESLDLNEINTGNTPITKKEFYDFFNKRESPSKRKQPITKFSRDMDRQEIQNIYRKYGRTLSKFNFEDAIMKEQNNKLVIEEMVYKGGIVEGLEIEAVRFKNDFSFNHLRDKFINCEIHDSAEPNNISFINCNIFAIDDVTNCKILNCNINRCGVVNESKVIGGVFNNISRTNRSSFASCDLIFSNRYLLSSYNSIFSICKITAKQKIFSEANFSNCILESSKIQKDNFVLIDCVSTNTRHIGCDIRESVIKGSSELYNCFIDNESMVDSSVINNNPNLSNNPPLDQDEVIEW